jgi:hypothetical protein
MTPFDYDPIWRESIYEWFLLPALNVSNSIHIGTSYRWDRFPLFGCESEPFLDCVFLLID